MNSQMENTEEQVKQEEQAKQAIVEKEMRENLENEIVQLWAAISDNINYQCKLFLTVTGKVVITYSKDDKLIEQYFNNALKTLDNSKEDLLQIIEQIDFYKTELNKLEKKIKTINKT